MELLKRTIRSWFPVAVATTLVCSVVYVVVQQDYRTSADDPQIQLAEDGAVAFTAGASFESIPPPTKVDVATSLAPFVIVYNQNSPIAANAVLEGAIPVPPVGIFEYAAKHGENRFTWQPRSKVRIAAVIKKVPGNNAYFILAGRSLREVEVRENNLTKQVFAGWAFSMVCIFIASLLVSFSKKPSKK